LQKSEHLQRTANYVERPAGWDRRAPDKEYKFMRDIYSISKGWVNWDDGAETAITSVYLILCPVRLAESLEVLIKLDKDFPRPRVRFRLPPASRFSCQPCQALCHQWMVQMGRNSSLVLWKTQLMELVSHENADRPPPYSYENSQQRRPQPRRPQQQNPQQRQTYSCGYGPQPTERTPMLRGQPDTGLESGVSSSPPTTRHIWISKLPSLLLALLVACYFGYNLNPYINSRSYETTRQRWAREEAKHQVLEAVWEEKRARHEEQEKQRRDDEIKKRDGISWVGLAAARCSRYATREYTAVLANVPLGFDALEECHKKTVDIHGRDLLPSRCEDQVSNYTQRDPGIH